MKYVQRVSLIVVALISCAMLSCSADPGEGYFVVINAGPGPMGEMSDENYLYSIDDLGIDEQIVRTIFDKYDSRAHDVEDLDRLGNLYKRRQTELGRHVRSALSTDFFLYTGIPSHVVRLPMEGLDKQFFREKQLFLKLNSVTPEAIRNGRKRPIEVE
jgi:hypothetical protein